MKVVTQLSIDIPNRPGSLAHISDMLRAADVNIEAIFCTETRKASAIHIVVDDPETAKIILRKIGSVGEEQVLAIQAKNKPGSIAHIARMCAGAGINIRHIYATSLGKEAMVYLAVDDIEKAKTVLK